MGNTKRRKCLNWLKNLSSNSRFSTGGNRNSFAKRGGYSFSRPADTLVNRSGLVLHCQEIGSFGTISLERHTLEGMHAHDESSHTVIIGNHRITRIQNTSIFL